MEELCYIDGCPGSGKFGCSCNDSLRVCQVHIAEHTCSFGYHEISSISFGITNQKIKDAIKSLNKLNTSTLKKSKEMFQELCNKLCDVVENLSQRQQCLFELSSSSCSQEIDKKIKELEQVNITFRNKKDFRKVLDNFMSSGEEIFENSSLDEFRKDFRIIIESLGKSNEVLQTVFDSQKVEKVFKEHLETRISSLEQKNSNFDEKLKILDQNTKICSSNLENFKKEIEKSNKSSKEIERMFKEKMIETRRNGKQLVDKIEALEISVTTSVHQSMKLLNEKNDDLGEKFCKIKDIKDPGFKGVLEGFFNEIYLRRIVKNS